MTSYRSFTSASFFSRFLSFALFISLVCFKTATCLSEEHKGGLVGARKLATAVDCSGVVAFSGTGTREVLKSGVLSYVTALTDRSVGWSLETGEFTIHCPGLYQLAFAGYGASPDTRLTLKKQKANSTEWDSIVTAGSSTSGGGSSSALLDLEVGDRTAIWVESGTPTKESTSFSAFRISKK